MLEIVNIITHLFYFRQLVAIYKDIEPILSLISLILIFIVIFVSISVTY